MTGRLIAIDGSKFKAAASKDRVLTRKQLRERRQRVERLVDLYLNQLDKADGEDVNLEMESKRVQQALARLEAESLQLDEAEEAMEERGSNQYCSTEPDANLMRSGREGMVLGYNIQTAVDADSGLIVSHDVTDRASDNRQLQPMGLRRLLCWGMEGAKAEIDQEKLVNTIHGSFLPAKPRPSPNSTLSTTNPALSSSLRK